MNNLSLYYYRRPSGKRNFGDDLSPLLLELATGRNIVWAPIVDCDVIGLGSNLNIAYKSKNRLRRRFARFRGHRPTVVWGAGFIAPSQGSPSPMLDARVLRGPRSAAALGIADIPFADPGLLVPELIKRQGGKKFRLGIIPHYVDLENPLVSAVADQNPDIKLISVEDEPLDTLRQIDECEFILSSSLHGLISADALGVPNWRVKLGEGLIGGDFKFLDYAEGVGRASSLPVEISADFDISTLEQTDASVFDYQRNIDAMAAAAISAITDLQS